MKIHAGYKISYDCPQPTPMVLQLSVHPSRTPDLLTWDRVQLDPPILANTYHDVFGNFCHVIHAPAGRLTMSANFLVQDKGEPDALCFQAQQHALQDLPVDTLVFLLGSRYCETDQNSMGRPYGRARRMSRLCPSRRNAVPVHEHSGTLLHGLPR